MVTSCWCSTICKNRERTSVARCEVVSHGGDVALRLTRGTRIVVDAWRGSRQQPINVVGAVCSEWFNKTAGHQDWIEALLKSCGARRNGNGLMINRNNSELGTHQNSWTLVKEWARAATGTHEDVDFVGLGVLDALKKRRSFLRSSSV
ncbi:hypothetical protein NL676_023306 [Syzygium grande]|nr:hypothetical protein NL676_023306 [Syzygium grande]